MKQYVLSPPLAISNNAANTVRSIDQSANRTTPTRSSPVGKNLPLENVNWKENKKTLVFYISTTCHFCNESVPFYQKLIKENSKNGITLVAVLPQEIYEAKRYLKSENLEIQRVYNASFESVGITGTPTLLLVDSEGVVSDLWRGKLSPDKESDVLSKLSS